MVKLFGKGDRHSRTESRESRAIASLKTKERRYMTEAMGANAAAQRERIITTCKAQIERQIGNMKALPGRSRSMEYFDKLADFYGPRAGEVKKFKETGGKVVGTLCVQVPAEIISAAGAVPVRFCQGIHEAVHPANELLGDAGLCPLAKSTLGTKMVEANPFLEMADLLVAPTPCDAKLKVGEILQDFMPVLLVNLPRAKIGETTRRQWLEEVRMIKDRVEELTGKKITRESLRASIETYQKARKAWSELSELRKAGRPMWGRDALLVSQAFGYDHLDRWTENVRALAADLKASKVQVGDAEMPRILLAGSPIIWPNWKIPNLIEESRGVIVADELCTATRLLYDPVVIDEWTMDGMMAALAERYMYPCTCPCFTPNQEREETIVNRCREYKAEGVVFHVLRGCHLNSLDATRIELRLKKERIPMLKIESEYDEGDVEQIRTRIEAFIEMIVARKEFLI